MLDFVLGEPQQHRTLTLYPLVADENLTPPYVLLGDALAAGTVQVTEVGNGTVPELMVKNEGEKDVLILDGEQLIGAKQNRMTNRTVILGAGTKTRVPVSCMEQGRWRFDSSSFRHGKHYSPSGVRSRARKHEAGYAQMGMAADHRVLAEAQGEVWAKIHDVADSLEAHTPTGKLDHVYEAKSRDLDEWLKAFRRVDGQVGLLAFLGDEVLGLDVIGGQELYAAFHQRLLGGYVIDALSSRGRDEESKLERQDAEHFLEGIRGARRTEASTVGKGTYRVLSGRVMGAELEDAGKLVHLSAFPADEDGRDRESIGEPIASPRRRHRGSI